MVVGLVTTATGYVVDVKFAKEALLPNMNSTLYKTKKLLKSHCSSHSNLVTMATW